MAAAARFLEVRPRSEDEVRKRLVSSGYPGPLVDTVIGRLLQLGYLDDAAFARAWIASRDRVRPRGMRALRLELLRKGVSAASIDEALAERDVAPGAEPDHPQGPAHRIDPEDEVPDGRSERAEVVAARRLLQRHRSALERVGDPRRRRQRTYALLARHGFDGDAIRQVMGELHEDAQGDGDGRSAGEDPSR